MPELPEVETVKRIIEPQIKGQRVLAVDLRNPQVIAHPESETFTALLTERTIAGMSRRGKFLSVDMDNGDRLFLHLRMTGQLLVTPPDYPEEKHTHLIINLLDGKQIRYIDVRRFGRLWYIKNGEDVSVTGIDKLGLEPDDERLTADFLKAKLNKKKKPIKDMLHDQTIIAGIGNIYSDEILFASRIYPKKKCYDLTDAEWEILAETIPKTVVYYTEKNAITPEEYLNGKGKEYRNTPFLKAYGHAGESCPQCGTLFAKITVGGRSSTYCPLCQISAQ
ncbi:MAG: bifunctional DNA-formamidopyrimidine glycosylase/DNA-(apurinic or apyrimidinic site) lyase [Clostridia bacterium]|nr:bifunctional DNA-formamidopyrimidine glycosylase/DNA-(apurinic or apyrimidinic site) lyase [Clostridia bacterium]